MGMDRLVHPARSVAWRTPSCYGVRLKFNFPLPLGNDSSAVPVPMVPIPFVRPCRHGRAEEIGGIRSGRSMFHDLLALLNSAMLQRCWCSALCSSSTM